MREATEVRQVSRETRVNIHGGDWANFCGMLGYDPLEETGRRHGSFKPVDHSLSFTEMIRLEYVERWQSSYNDNFLVVEPRYRHQITYIWWW